MVAYSYDKLREIHAIQNEKKSGKKQKGKRRPPNSRFKFPALSGWVIQAVSLVSRFQTILVRDWSIQIVNKPVSTSTPAFKYNGHGQDIKKRRTVRNTAIVKNKSNKSNYKKTGKKGPLSGCMS